MGITIEQVQKEVATDILKALCPGMFQFIAPDGTRVPQIPELLIRSLELEHRRLCIKYLGVDYAKSD